MSKYFIRAVQEDDHISVAGVYNSDPRFLLNHLGVDCVDAGFVAEEAANMRKAGFLSCAIVDHESAMVQGVLDYKPGREVYLSLLMLSADVQGRGLGRRVYADFESQMRQNGSASIRIDVVNDYPGNVLPFWKELGFRECGDIVLSWGNKKSRAVVMKKCLK